MDIPPNVAQSQSWRGIWAILIKLIGQPLFDRSCVSAGKIPLLFVWEYIPLQKAGLIFLNGRHAAELPVVDNHSHLGAVQPCWWLSMDRRRVGGSGAIPLLFVREFASGWHRISSIK